MARKSVLESPWYWVYAFCTAAVLGLVLMGPKILERTVQNERSHQGRTRAAENTAGVTPVTEMSTRDRTRSTLRPFYYLLAAVIAFSWLVLWWKHFRPQRQSNRNQGF